jgi:hypothetical protein
MNSAGLYPYQVTLGDHFVKLLRAGQNVLDGSKMGSGKTFTAGGVIRELDLPTLVLAPQISLTPWRRMGEHLGVEFDVINPEMVRTGKTPYGIWSNPKPPGPSPVKFVCLACQCEIDPATAKPCALERTGIHCIETKKVPHDYGKFIWNEGIKFLVVDEAHRFGALESLQSEMLVAAKRQGIKILAMSATAADSPLNLRALGYALGLHTLIGENGFYRFAFNHGVKRHPFGGLYFGGEESERLANMARLHHLIFPKFGGRVPESEFASWPECQITAELYDLKESGKMEELYEQMDDCVQALNTLRATDVPDLEITKMLRIQQELELVMVPVFEEITNQLLEAGLHVPIFVNYRQTMEELAKRFKTGCLIYGGQNPKHRQQNIDDFQDDKEPVLIAISAAGGISISLHDLHGRFPRGGVASLNYSGVIMRQVFGRLPRAGAKSRSLYRIPLIAGTRQEKIHRALACKLNQIDALNDGDLWAGNLPLTNRSSAELFSHYAS